MPSCGFSNSKIKQEKKKEATNALKNTKETYLEMSVFIVINIYRYYIDGKTQILCSILVSRVEPNLTKQIRDLSSPCI